MRALAVENKFISHDVHCLLLCDGKIYAFNVICVLHLLPGGGFNLLLTGFFSAVFDFIIVAI